jgi:23S rRNA (cytosine1962-C5)-methyltransferase
MQTTIYPEITLKKGREASLLRGHPWVFSGAIASVKGNPATGDIILAKDCTGRPLALGFYNPRTDIAFRLLTRDCDQEINAEFWQKCLESAIQLRKKIINQQTNAYRLINAEGDGFPGLIVDVYNSVIVFSIATAGIEKQKEHIMAALKNQIAPKIIYEQSEGKSRKLEGLANARGYTLGDDKTTTTEIMENGLKFDVDFVGGQKTGFFLDQRVNREKVGALSRAANVLNCFAYTGAFSVYCAAGKARRVLSLDISKTACIAARKNLEQNEFSNDDHPVIEIDVFNYLRNSTENFDLIILDPPAFAKAKRDVSHASRGYKEINMQAVKRLNPGGLLATFSCSNFVEEELFGKIVLGAARDAGSDLQLLSRLEAGPDHPLLLAHSEGRYLKGLLLKKS